MKSNKTLLVTNTGKVDNWSRPIYTDVDGNTYKDINMNDNNPALYTHTGNYMDGEPDMPVGDFKVVSREELKNSTSDINETMGASDRCPNCGSEKYVKDEDFCIDCEDEGGQDFTNREFENKDETYIKTIEFEGDKLTLHKIADNPMKTQFYLQTMDGEPYIDINKILPDNMLIDAIWVETGGLEEKIADSLDILSKTDRTTTSGHSSYVMYNIKG